MICAFIIRRFEQSVLLYCPFEYSQYQKIQFKLTKETLNVHYKHRHKPTLMLLGQIIAVDCTNGIIHGWGSFEY